MVLQIHEPDVGEGCVNLRRQSTLYVVVDVVGCSRDVEIAEVDDRNKVGLLFGDHNGGVVVVHLAVLCLESLHKCWMSPDALALNAPRRYL